MTHPDPFDLDDHRPRRATELDLTDEQLADEAFLEALLVAFSEDDDSAPATALSRAWEASRDAVEGQVTS